MGVVTDYLRVLIARQVQESGIVVWYDPERAYEAVAVRLPGPEGQGGGLDDSLCRLRAQADPLREFVGSDGRFTDAAERAPRLVVYVPRARGELEDALVEFEAAGSVLEPGAAALPRNTRLEGGARHALRRVLTAGQGGG